MDRPFIKRSKKIIYLLQKITVLVFLQITEQLIEPNFICQCNAYGMCFVIMYFIIPAAACSVFACSLQQGNIIMVRGSCLQRFKEKCCSCRNTWEDTCEFFISLFKILYPALCWFVILLIDGKYLACGLYSKCDSNVSTVNMKDVDMVHGMVVSKICGLAVVCGFVLFYSFYLFWYHFCQSPAHWYEKMYMSKLEKASVEATKSFVDMSLDCRAKRCKEKLDNELESTAARTFQKILKVIREEFIPPENMSTPRDGYQNVKTSSPGIELGNVSISTT